MQITLKSIAQQGASVIPTSFNMVRMKQNLDIFVWELNEDETNKNRQIPQRRLYSGEFFVSEARPYK